MMTGVAIRMIAFITLRANLQATMDKFRESMEIESAELWREAVKELGSTYEPFIDFVLAGKSQFDTFFKIIGEMLNEGDSGDPSTSIVFTLLDVAGMCDHAVAYGVYLIKEFQRMLDDKDIESLMENQDKFPVTMKIAHSQSEADDWVKEQKTKDREENQESPNDLSKMKPIGGMQ
jgi:ribosomal protein L12E/L44/L45/RPP1/RPP2